MSVRTLGLFLLAGMGAACAPLSWADHPSASDLPLQSTPPFEGSVLFRQQVQYRGEKIKGIRVLNTVLQVDSDRATLLVLSPMGSTSHRIVLEGGTLRVHQHSPFPLPVEPTRMFRDHQLVFWPRLELPPPYRVVSRGDTRTVYRGGTRLVVVDHPGLEAPGSSRRLNQVQLGYSVLMESTRILTPSSADRPPTP